MKEEKNESGLGCFLGLVLLGLLGPAAIWRGYILSVLWSWFVVPTFDIPRLSVAVAIGISLVVTMLIGDNGKGDSDEDDEPQVTFVFAIAKIFFLPLFILGIGWIVKGFM